MMTTHAVDVQTNVQSDAQGGPTGVFRYRWRCSCGRCGRWHAGSHDVGAHADAARRARNGGARHVAAMERGER